MNISFKGAYYYNPSDRKDVKAINSIKKGASDFYEIATAKSGKIMLTDETLAAMNRFIYEELSNGNSNAGHNEIYFNRFSHSEGVPIAHIKFSEIYEKTNFNIVKKGTLALGRALKQLLG